MVNDLIAERAEDITNILIENALAYDSGCLKLAIELLAPAPKDNRINLELPNIEQSGDLNTAIAQITSKVGSVDITTLEGQGLIKMFEAWKSAYSLEETELRVTKLEEHNHIKTGQ